MTHGTVLLVDDEEKILKTLGRALREDEHEVTTTSSPQEALRLLGARQFDVLIVDYLMPGLTGMDVVRELQAALPEPERPGVLMMTAHGTVRNAVEAMKLGVRDYLQKPFDIDELLVSVRRTVEEQQARNGLRYLLSEQKNQFGQYGIVGRSRAVQDVIARVELVARSRSTVLITGETGTGKELVARAIHDRSARTGAPAHPRQLRGAARRPAGIGAVRARPRRVHGCDQRTQGAVRARRRRFDLPRRDLHHQRQRAGQAAARAPGTRVRAARRRAHATRRRARDRRHEPRPAGARRRGQVPERPLLPAQRHPDPHSAAARASRGHPDPRRAFHPAHRRVARKAGPPPRRWRDSMRS